MGQATHAVGLLREETTGATMRLGDELARGGEGALYEVIWRPDVVAKVYHEATDERAAKLAAMVAHPPADPTRDAGHVSIAWPVSRLLDARGRCAGFLMPRLDRATSLPLLTYYNPRDRKRIAPEFTWRYLLRTAANLASVVEALHATGYVIGDVNESNLLVTTAALVTVVDCDSMQVPDPSGHPDRATFRCPVGKPEYTPPELHGRDFATVDRTPVQDCFGLAVLIFMLLMEGAHPFAGVWTGPGEPPGLAERIERGACPYIEGGAALATPPAAGLPFASLPPEIQALFRRCFGEGLADPAARPSAQEWRDALALAEQHLVQCQENPRHWYAEHCAACPWCERMDAFALPDPFPDPATVSIPARRGAQRPLAPVQAREMAARRSRTPPLLVPPPPLPDPQAASAPQALAPTLADIRAKLAARENRPYLVAGVGGLVALIAYFFLPFYSVSYRLNAVPYSGSLTGAQASGSSPWLYLAALAALATLTGAGWMIATSSSAAWVTPDQAAWTLLGAGAAGLAGLLLFLQDASGLFSGVGSQAPAGSTLSDYSAALGIGFWLGCAAMLAIIACGVALKHRAQP